MFDDSIDVDARERFVAYLKVFGFQEFDSESSLAIEGDVDLEGGGNVIYVALIDFDEGRRQSVFLQLMGNYYLLFSPFAKVVDISHERASKANHSIFGMRSHGDLYFLQNVGAVYGFNILEFSTLVQAIAKEADTIEKLSGGGDSL